MLTDSRFHRRSDSQGLVNPREVVVHVKQGDHRDVMAMLRQGAWISNRPTTQDCLPHTIFDEDSGCIMSPSIRYA